MKLARRAFLGSSLAIFAAPRALAQQWADPQMVGRASDAPVWPPRERYPLWPGTPPGGPAPAITHSWTMFGTAPTRQLWIRGIATPEIHVFRPARPDGSALLCVPGGGYGFVAVQNEGLDVAQRFTADGMTVFVLTYRLPGEGWPNRHLVPLQDAQRAMRLIRSRAAEFRIDPERLGVIGFSAGGHLAGDLAVSFAERTYEPGDAADRLSARPAYVGLIYPVTGMRLGVTHGGSRNNLLGPNPSSTRVDERSPTLKITRNTPASFLVHAADDDLVPVENSMQWLAACRALKHSCEAHIFANGGHGFGLGLPRDNPGSRWPDLFALWLRKHGG